MHFTPRTPAKSAFFKLVEKFRKKWSFKNLLEPVGMKKWWSSNWITHFEDIFNNTSITILHGVMLIRGSVQQLKWLCWLIHAECFMNLPTKGKQEKRTSYLFITHAIHFALSLHTWGGTLIQHVERSYCLCHSRQWSISNSSRGHYMPTMTSKRIVGAPLHKTWLKRWTFKS